MQRPSMFLVGSVMLSATLLLRCGGGAADESDLLGGAGAPSEDVCEAADTRTCVGPGACDGGQACKSDGSGWEACDCGGAATGGSGGDDGSGGSNAVDACQPTVVESCDEGERCEAIAQGEDPENMEFVLTCVPAGEGVPGDSCESGTDCVASAFCATDTCREFCDVNGYCGPEEACFYSVYSGVGGINLCEPTCNLLGNDCINDQVCLPQQGNALCLDSVGTTPLGEFCSTFDDCVVGTLCIGLSDSAPGTCRELCATTGANNCSFSEYACSPLTIYDPYQEFEPAGVGVCTECPTSVGDCELLYAGGCDEESECDPLSELWEIDYTCDDGICVEAP